MKLYLAPGACSLASHIALHEAGLDFERIRVDLRSKRLADGVDFLNVNPKGYVPALLLDDGQLLTENIAILDWIAQRHPALGVAGDMGRTRQLEMLAFISTEIHKQFSRSFFPTCDAEKLDAAQKIDKRLRQLADDLEGEHLFGSQATVADAYLYVMLRWAVTHGHQLPPALAALKARLEARPAVRLALQHEGLDRQTT
jgi:glutathione S-transferase